MPVQVEHPVKALSEQEFHDLDFQVMRLAFDTHNRLGRFYDEKIYQNELIRLCNDEGLKTASEVKIQLMHTLFFKNLFIDCLIEDGAIYELKAAESISSSHRVQTLGYLFLSNVQHGKIINFRPSSVEHEFVSTTLTLHDRLKIHLIEKSWNRNSATALKLKSLVTDLFSDWGLFLNTDWYREAICHLWDGGRNLDHSVEIKSGSVVLGKQIVPLIAHAESFCISSIKNKISVYQAHLQRFLDHTDLQALHWININHFNVKLNTLSNRNHSDLNYSA